MKICASPVSRPRVEMPDGAARVRRQADLVAHVRPVAGVLVRSGTPALDDEVRHDAVERQAVVVAGFHQPQEPHARQRRGLGQQVDPDRLPAAQLDPGRHVRIAGLLQLDRQRERRTRKRLRSDLVRPARPLLERRAAARCATGMSKSWSSGHERAGLIRIANLGEPLEQREPSVARRLLPLRGHSPDGIDQRRRRARASASAPFSSIAAVRSSW